MKLGTILRFPRDARRVGEIIAVLARFGLADWLKGLNYSWIQERLRSVDGEAISGLEPEERVRLAFTELGTTFIKLGQMLSTRADLVGAAMAEELARLQAGAPSDPLETVNATIRAELGRPPEELFARFDPEPLALNAPSVLGGVSVFGAAGYLLALWWGWRLFRVVRRSGDIDSSDRKP